MGYKKNVDVLKESIYEIYEKEDMAVVLGDSIEVMKLMESDSVDLIFADQPYNIGKNFGNNKDSWETTEEYLEWNKIWIEEAMRLLKKNGTMYLMTATQYMPYIDVYMQEHYHVLSRIVWSYDSSGVQSKKIYGSLYEPILMVTKSNQSNYTFNAEDILVEAKTGAKRKLIDYRKNPPQPYNTKKVPGNVWEFTRVRYRMAEYEKHPTQKPESLLNRIIKASSNENDLVFDPFGGTFTTGAVAKKLNRKFIGVDLNPEYIKIGLRRLNIADEYKGEKLSRDRSRVTNNKSKKDHVKKELEYEELRLDI